MNKSYQNRIQKLIFLFVFMPFTVFSVLCVFYLTKAQPISIKITIILLVVLVNISLYILSIYKLPGIFLLEFQRLSQSNAFDFKHSGECKKIEELILERLELSKSKNQLHEHIQTTSETVDALLAELDQLKMSIHELTQNNQAQEGINRTIISSSNQFVLQIDEDGNIQKVNDVFTSRLGYSEPEVLGTNILALIEQKEDQSQTWKQIVNDAIHNPVYVSIKLKSSMSISSEFVNLTASKLENGTYLCIGKAINDEISLQSNILRKNRELEYVNQINSSLISNWDIKDLLDNIIKRIDYLFNIYVGGIYILNSNKQWELKAYSSDTLNKTMITNINIENYISRELIENPEIKTVKINYLDMNYLTLLPLEVDQEIMAIMAIGTVKQMSPNDMMILKMFKNQAAMVIQRSIIYEQLRKQYFGTIEALVNVIEAKDKYTEGHSRRVSRFAVVIATKLGYSNEEIENVEIAGLLHDIGKIGIDQAILCKQGELTDYEYDEIKKHPTKGIQILQSINFEENIKDAILYHHLRYDLKGYPMAEKQLESLPAYASIIGIADAFDAITSARSYSKARTKEEGLLELVKYKGSQFAPELVDVFESLITEEPEKIQEIIEDTALSD